MKIDSEAIRRLGIQLRERGEDGGETPEDAESTPEQNAIIGRVGPMCEVLYLTMSADGECDASERETIRGAVGALTADQLSAQLIDRMLDRFEASARSFGRTERLISVAGQLAADREDAEAALALAAAVAVADGTVAASEREILGELAEWLGISDGRAAVILDAEPG